MVPHLSRRSLLSAGALGVAGMAGCIEHFEQAIYLGGVRIENRADTASSFDVEITKEDVLVHDATYTDVPADPGGDEGIYADCEWPNQERGEFEVAIREADADDWSITASSESDRDEFCQLCRVEYTGDDLRFFWEDCNDWRAGDDDPLCRYGF